MESDILKIERSVCNNASTAGYDSTQNNVISHGYYFIFGHAS
jgi:hypothetical protein